jgi:hypothetical protein
MSKKIIAALAALAFVSMLFVSCGSTPEQRAEKAMAQGKIPVGKEGVPQPSWVNKTPKDAENFYAIGYANKSTKQISITAAEQDGRDQIARWIGVSVKNALTNYTNESGEAANTQTLAYFENISKQVSDQTLAGVERNEIWVDYEGGVYVLLMFPKANLNKSFEDETNKTFARNEAAAYAEFKAKDALSFLDKETSEGVKK